MSKSNAFENALLLHIFNNANITNLGDAIGVRGSTAAGSLYVSLHTADPGEAGDQSTSECTYAGYSRVAVARSGAGWVVTGNSASPASDVAFANPSDATNLPQTATHFGIGVASSGAGTLLYSGALEPDIVISNTGVTPIVASTSTVTED